MTPPAAAPAADAPDWNPASAVILVNLGSPRAPTPRAVADFLAEFLSDRRVVELPRLLWQPVLTQLISTETGATGYDRASSAPPASRRTTWATW